MSTKMTYSEQEVKDVISSVLYSAIEAHKRLALEEVMNGRFGSSSESFVLSGKIEACKEIARRLGVNISDLYYMT